MSKECCRKCSTVTLGLSIALCVVGLLLLVMGPITAQMTAYSVFIKDYEITTCLISTKSVIQTDCEDRGYLGVFWSSTKESFAVSPTSAKKYQVDANAQLNEYTIGTRYDCYCQTTTNFFDDPLTCNVWPTCFLDINSVLEFKKVYQIHIVGQVTWIISFVLITLFVFSLVTACIIKRCTKRKGYEELAVMQAKLDKWRHESARRFLWDLSAKLRKSKLNLKNFIKFRLNRCWAIDHTFQMFIREEATF